MTIGPAPMMRTLLMSVRLGTSAARIRTHGALLHQLHEAIEQVADIVRSRARFGVSLKAERRAVGARKALEAAVEERDVGGLEVRRQRARIDRKTVVLAGDDYRARFKILHRMIRAVVPELHLEGLGARCESHQLVA